MIIARRPWLCQMGRLPRVHPAVNAGVVRRSTRYANVQSVNLSAAQTSVGLFMRSPLLGPIRRVMLPLLLPKVKNDETRVIYHFMMYI